MATPYLGEIRLFSYSKVPRGWAQCNGQLMSVNQNKPLFTLLGTAYGGDGVNSFALPDLRGRAPIHFGKGYNLANSGGEATHALTNGEMPSHTHSLTASSSGASLPGPGGNLWAVLPDNAYAPQTSQNTSLSPASLANTGNNQGHDNMAPYLTVNFCIAISGIFPSRT